MRGALLGGVALLLLTGADSNTTVDILGILREFGFPILVCLWFMWRLEKRIDRFTESIEKLYQINVVLTKAIDDLDPINPLPAPQSVQNRNP